MTPPLLEIRGVGKAFGGNVVLAGLDLDLAADRVSALVGPNGAGKTTLFNVITGVLAPDAGEIRFRGRPIHGLAPHRVARLGIARSFQGLRLFRTMTVYENVLVACETGVRDLWQRGAHRARVERVLERTGLVEKRDVRAADLSYAEQKFLSLARLIAQDAELLLLDEPASGLDGPSLVRFHDLVRSLHREGRTLLVIEHNLDIVRSVADRIAFLDRGSLLAYGTPEELFAQAHLADIYFGAAGGR